MLEAKQMNKRQTARRIGRPNYCSGYRQKVASNKASVGFIIAARRAIALYRAWRSNSDGAYASGGGASRQHRQSLWRSNEYITIISTMSRPGYQWHTQHPGSIVAPRPYGTS